MADKTKPTPRQAKLLLLGLGAYVLVLAVLAADQVFGLGLLPPQLDTHISRNIKSLGDTSLPPEKRRQVMRQIIDYHEFSIPHLINALEKGAPALRQPATFCLVRIGAEFFNLSEERARTLGSDATRWRTWWRATEADLERRSS